MDNLAVANPETIKISHNKTYEISIKFKGSEA